MKDRKKKPSTKKLASIEKQEPEKKPLTLEEKKKLIHSLRGKK